MWSKPKVYGEPPPACRAHSAVVYEEKSRIYLFGGGDGPVYYNHLYVLDVPSMIWSRPQTTGPIPSPRRAHISVIWHDKMYIFGGGDGVHALNDVYQLDLKTNEWSILEVTGALPEPRGYHTGNLVGDKLVIYGGSDGHTCFGDVHLLDLGEKWL